MIVDRMTTLIQKTLGRPLKNFNDEIRNHLLSLKNEIQKELESRGIRFTMVDFAALVEEFSPNGSRATLGFMLNFLRPFSAGMGFRVTRISDTQVEIVIPWIFRNRNDRGQLHEASYLPAALEAVHIFWQRHIEGPFEIQLIQESLRIHQALEEDARLRTEVTSSLREVVLGELRENPHYQIEMKFQIFGSQDRLSAELELKMSLKKVLILADSSSRSQGS